VSLKRSIKKNVELFKILLLPRFFAGNSFVSLYEILKVSVATGLYDEELELIDSIDGIKMEFLLISLFSFSYQASAKAFSVGDSGFN